MNDTVLIGNNKSVTVTYFQKLIKKKPLVVYSFVAIIAFIVALIHWHYHVTEYIFTNFGYFFYFFLIFAFWFSILSVALFIIFVFVFKKSSNLSRLLSNSDKIREYLKLENFTVIIDKNSYFALSKENKCFQYCNIETNTFSPLVNFEDLISVELLEKDKVVSKVSNSIGNTVIGGALFGGLGAVAGSLAGKNYVNESKTEYSIRIITRNFEFSGVQVIFNDPSNAVRLLNTISLVIDPK
jgi:uncharacterized membrane protein